MKQIKVGNAIACEYISIGAGSKPILLHVYTGEIQVSSLPARFPLCFYIEIQPDPQLPTDIKIEIWQDETVRASLEVEFNIEPDKLGLLITPPIVFTVEAAGEIRVVATCEGFRPTVLFKKRVLIGEITEA